jgi:hypothetical protein
MAIGSVECPLESTVFEIGLLAWVCGAWIGGYVW